VCAGDETLRREVEKLIAAHEKDGSFIDSPAYADTELLIDRQAVLTAGQPQGPYKVISHIGSGGMGEVYLAEDTGWAVRWRSNCCAPSSPRIKTACVASGRRRARLLP
ncbi:MAG: hypothetical protein LC776_18535, partial [Acidobacteria bacterium]|nr:hypothetical protein [Acidobacteriota bacterium]